MCLDRVYKRKDEVLSAITRYYVDDERRDERLRATIVRVRGYLHIAVGARITSRCTGLQVKLILLDVKLRYSIYLLLLVLLSFRPLGTA